MGRVRYGSKRSNGFRVHDHTGSHHQLLDHGRDTDLNDLSDLAPVRHKAIYKAKMQVPLAHADIKHRIDKRNKLADDGGERSAGYSHRRETEMTVDEAIVEEDIDDVGGHVVDHGGS